MRLLRWGLVACGLACTTIATAAPPPPNKQLALKRFQEGFVSLNKHDFEPARLSFLQAYSLDPDPRILWDLALSEAMTHHALEALRHFRAILRASTSRDKDIAESKPYMDVALRETGHFVVTIDPETIVTVDGTVVTTPLDEPIDVTPGAHTLDARWGGKEKTVTLTPGAGETIPVDLRIAESSATPTPSPSVAAPPALPPPASPAPAPIPSESVKPPPSEASPQRGSSATRAVTTAALGVGALASIMAGILVRSSSSTDDAHAKALLASSASPQSACFGSNPTSACQESRNSASSASTERDTSTVFFVVGGGLAVATVATWILLAPKPSAAPSTSWSPQISPTSAGFVVHGPF